MSFQSNGTRNRGEEDEVCPVCKSSRYLNPDMRFLINPECYHKMCESCVDRIFSSGPAPCPVAGCNKTLRKNRFRKQTFEDIGVEREVDVRKRVMQILNRREDEFDNKLAYDNFLEQREDIITNLVSGIDVAKTEAQLSQYAAANSKSIRRNQALESQESAAFLQHQSLEQEQIRLRRETARQDYDNERRAILSGREDVLNRLATGTVEDAEAIAKEGRQGMLKISSARRSEEERLKRKQGALLAESKRAQALADAADKGIAPAFDSDLVKGLRKIKTPEPEKAIRPFWWDQARRPRLLSASRQLPVNMLAGGYDLREYYARTLLEAFAGLGCFIDEEIAARNASANPSPTGLAASAAASTPIPVDEEML
ncbi:CDK-activating kinase assembly factor MAT1 [Histoplasma capsulatum H143]|uniref:RNA polymerase II transcription factor B subunit 3 n=1 Tax=Ajellomyces capsulatus (strain H143) TaxID=544712 RepID=C6H2Z7_AJECH|nr:CDK-activating kinase assembly factor MAT1 [Histoplasma capsulatum H143]